MITEIVQALADAGATPEMLVAAVRAAEGEMLRKEEARRSAGRERVRKHRERNAVKRDVTLQSVTYPPDKEEKGFQTFLKEEINPPLATLATRAREGDFDIFWKEWPHKVGKPAALKAFLRARRASSLEAIISGRDRYIAEKPPDRQWLNPATFLNQERFNDEPAAVVEPAKRELPHDTLLRALATVAKDGPGAVGWSPGFDGAANVTRLADTAYRAPRQRPDCAPKPRPHIAEAVARARSLGGDPGGVVVGLPDTGNVGFPHESQNGGILRGTG